MLVSLGFGSDGAPVMTGSRSGVAKRLTHRFIVSTIDLHLLLHVQLIYLTSRQQYRPCFSSTRTLLSVSLGCMLYKRCLMILSLS